jgi:hypothetical protein
LLGTSIEHIAFALRWLVMIDSLLRQVGQEGSSKKGKQAEQIGQN